MSALRVLVVDDHEVVRAGLRAVLESEEDIELVFLRKGKKQTVEVDLEDDDLDIKVKLYGDKLHDANERMIERIRITDDDLAEKLEKLEEKLRELEEKLEKKLK